MRFDSDARLEVEEMVHTLEVVAARLEAHGLVLPPHPTIVVHPTAFSLSLAQPAFLAMQGLTETHGRRYVASWVAGGTLHVITPGRHARGEQRVVGLKDALDRAPATGLAHLALSHANPALSLTRALSRRQWLWLAWGAGQALVGQVPLLASSIAVRRRMRRALVLPPAPRDAVVLGGSVVELVLRTRGLTALVRMLKEPLPAAPEGWLGRALPGLGSTERDVRWRMLLDDLDRQRTAVLAELAAAETAAAEEAAREAEAAEAALQAARFAKAQADAAAEHAELDAAAERAAARSAARRGRS